MMTTAGSRAIGDLLLVRADGSSQRLYSVSAQIQRDRTAYCDILERTQKGSMDVTDWLRWFLATVLKALHRAHETVDAVLMKARFWQHWSGTSLNARHIRLINLLIDGFDGKLTSSKWAAIAKCSPDTALRDITALLGLGIMQKSDSSRRSTHYELKDLFEKSNSTAPSSSAESFTPGPRPYLASGRARPAIDRPDAASGRALHSIQITTCPRLSRRTGRRLNVGRIRQLWKMASLQLPRERPRSRGLGRRDHVERTSARVGIPAYDFGCEACSNRRQPSCRMVVDAQTREVLEMSVARCIRSECMSEGLSRLVSERSAPGPAIG